MSNEIYIGMLLIISAVSMGWIIYRLNKELDKLKKPATTLNINKQEQIFKDIINFNVDQKLYALYIMFGQADIILTNKGDKVIFTAVGKHAEPEDNPEKVKEITG